MHHNAGLEDAIGMSMIHHASEYPFQSVMRMNTMDLEVRSRLKHSFFIMKRHLRDIGKNLTELMTEMEWEHRRLAARVDMQ